MKIPLLSDLTHQISKDYGVYLEDQGHTLRYFTGLQFGWVFAGVVLNALYLKKHLKFFFESRFYLGIHSKQQILKNTKKFSHNESEEGSRQGKYAGFTRTAVAQGPPKSKWSQD